MNLLEWLTKSATCFSDIAHDMEALEFLLCHSIPAVLEREAARLALNHDIDTRRSLGAVAPPFAAASRFNHARRDARTHQRGSTDSGSQRSFTTKEIHDFPQLLDSNTGRGLTTFYRLVELTGAFGRFLWLFTLRVK